MSTLMLSVIRFTYSRACLLKAAFYSSQPEHAKKNVGKIVNVAIIGAPNSGKSTLINKIVERKVSRNLFWSSELALEQSLQ